MKNIIVKAITTFSLAAISVLVFGGGLPEKPNIIMVLADDHAVNAISAYGSEHIRTPHIDRLAGDGVLFQHCFATNSICNPSRASILTGKYSHFHGVKTNYIKPDNDLLTYPELLKKAGYQTALVGKTHFRPESNFIKSLDFYMIERGGGYHDPQFLKKNGNVHPYEGYVTDIVTEQGIQWLKSTESSDPFLLMLHHPAPHMPFHEKEVLQEAFKNNHYKEPASFWDQEKNRQGMPRPFNITMEGLMTFQGREKAYGEKAWKVPEDLQEKERKQWIYQRYMRAYMACIRSLDENMGKLMKYLKDSGLDKNTIVIYTSDQGFFLGEHGWYDKRFFYEESIRMPLIIKHPQVSGGRRCDKIALNIDLPETILDMAGVTVPQEMQGASLVPLLKHPQETKHWRKAMFYEYFEDRPDSPLPVWAHEGVRTEQFKLIRFMHNGQDHWELFNLKKDPYELHNIYHSKKSGKIKQQLKAKLRKLKADSYNHKPEKE